jgi:hypothetical protein
MRAESYGGIPNEASKQTNTRPQVPRMGEGLQVYGTACLAFHTNSHD